MQHKGTPLIIVWNPNVAQAVPLGQPQKGSRGGGGIFPPQAPCPMKGAGGERAEVGRPKTRRRKKGISRNTRRLKVISTAHASTCGVHCGGGAQNWPGPLAPGPSSTQLQPPPPPRSRKGPGWDASPPP